jgi:hypothetical protein
MPSAGLARTRIRNGRYARPSASWFLWWPDAQTRYDSQQAARMLADSDQVQAMDDHQMLYGHPDAFTRMGFLPMAGPARPPGTGSTTQPWPAHDDLAADLTTTIERYLTTHRLGMVVIDQTSPEHLLGRLPLRQGHCAGHLIDDLRPPLSPHTRPAASVLRPAPAWLPWPGSAARGGQPAPAPFPLRSTALAPLPAPTSQRRKP